MTDEELVKQLRDIGDHAGYEPSMHHTAADAIEHLRQRAEKAEARATDAELGLVAAETAAALMAEQRDRAKARSRVSALESEIERLRERAEKAEADLLDANEVIGRLNSGAELQSLMRGYNELVARTEKAERENSALYEWKERAGQMDREKTVRIVELEAERDEAVARAKTNAILMAALREVHEVYAGSEGIPAPMTATEGYLLGLVKEMAKISGEVLAE